MTLQAKHKELIQIGLVLLFLLLAVFVLDILGAFKSPQTTHDVLFQVNAQGGYALITLKTPDRSILPAIVVHTPWSLEMTIPRGSEVYLTAGKESQIGELSCSISLENHLWKSSVQYSPKNGVACAGIIP
jgi:hypothetical protein